MAGWTNLKKLLEEEIVQRREEGCNVDGFRERWEALGEDKAGLDALYDELMLVDIDPAFPYNEPSDYEGIQEQRSKNAPMLQKIDEIDKDRFVGAWLGRCCGCALGVPLETGEFMAGKDGIPGWKLVYEWFKGANEYPIKNYVPTESTATEKYGVNVRNCKSLKDRIAFMDTDDDIRYTVLGLMMLEKKGLDFEPLDVGKLWHNTLTLKQVCTAETQAYLNYAYAHDLLGNESTLEQKDKILDWVRTHRNPYREWIGAQIRVDGYAYGAAGDPELAAELAWRDSSFSHVKNGIYGAMFCSAMIATAFVEKDSKKIVQAGLAQIPQNSRLAHDIKKAIVIAENATDEIDLVSKIWDAFSHYSHVHTNNNASLCAAAIIYAGNDFEKAIGIAVLGGWDTDCNGATVGSIMGAKLGTKGIPDTFAKPLNDKLYSAIPEFHPIAISECGERSYQVYKKLKSLK
ncbi:MAG: ADP-ribosylglycohydrolase family protein [Hyphomonadaceae bacterium]|nr:ADP-ribosylglycohydrolase family protein [Clostridia bacterium]